MECKVGGFVEIVPCRLGNESVVGVVGGGQVGVNNESIFLDQLMVDKGFSLF